MIKFTFLWSDVLFFLLLLGLLVFVFYSLKHEHLRKPWRKCWQHKRSVLAMLVLLVYLLIALLDSIHFQQSMPNSAHSSVKTVSLLDKILTPIGQRSEKSYVAPMQLHLFKKEGRLNQQNQYYRYYPQVKHAPFAALEQYTQSSHILSIIMRACIDVAILACIFLFLFALYKRVFVWQWLTKASISRFIFVSIVIIAALMLSLVMLAKQYYLLGTDKVGHDVFYAVIKSIRTGLLIGTLTTIIILPFALLLGTAAGFFGGIIDDIVQYVYTVLSSIPGVLLIAASVLSLQLFINLHPQWFPNLLERSDMRLLALCFILGITSWTSLCRLLRAETLKVKEMAYIEVSRALGVKPIRIIFRHVIPNVWHIVLITLVLDFSNLVLAEAVLSYVGVGVDPLTFSWGNMINAARLEMAHDPVIWWPLMSAFLLMFLLVLCANLFADSVRDAFDPRSA